MNQKGKEQMAKKIVLTIKSLLHKKKINPIIMSENTPMDILPTDHRMGTTPEHNNMKPNNTQKFTSNKVTSITTRPNKPPNTMLRDFLW
jgi:hypothetical protein